MEVVGWSKVAARRIPSSHDKSIYKWLIWKRNVFAFDVKRESHCLFSLPLPVSEGNDNKDIGLIEYKGKLVMTYIDKESNFMEVWIMKDHNRK